MAFTKIDSGGNKISGGQTVLITVMRTILHITLTTLDLRGLKTKHGCNHGPHVVYTAVSTIPTAPGLQLSCWPTGGVVVDKL